MSQLGFRARVLVVDDEGVNRRVARALCEYVGCEVETADGGAPAVALCAEHLYDLVLMDIRMPGMDGFQASRAIRALPGAHGSVPIVAVTADTHVRLGAEHRNAGIDAVIEKPLFVEVLRDRLRRTLETRDAHRGALAGAAS